ncbi:hypothetical protein N308_05771, partial [Struthio camelus australis]
ATGSAHSCRSSFKPPPEAQVSFVTGLQSWTSGVSSNKDSPEDNLFFLAVLSSSTALLLNLRDLGKNMLLYT